MVLFVSVFRMKSLYFPHRCLRVCFSQGQRIHQFNELISFLTTKKTLPCEKQRNCFDVLSEERKKNRDFIDELRAIILDTKENQ